MFDRRIPTRGVVLVGGLMLLLASCSGDNDPPTAPTPVSSGTASAPAAGASTAPETPPTVLASVAGAGLKTTDVTIDVTSLRRSETNSVTLLVTIRNSGSAPFSFGDLSPATGDYKWPSASGATLVDTVGKLRYYPLRDTNKVCICTKFLLDDRLPVGGEVQLTTLFPAPPAGVDRLTVDWTGFAPAVDVPLS